VIDRRPYLLAPERPIDGEPRPLREGETETELNDAWKERAREAGIVMRRPGLSPNTNLAHEATAYARDKGRDGEFHHAAARAYWEDGVDLGNRQVLLDLGVECGLDVSELGAVLDSGQYRDYVLGEHQAAKDLGVFGTPTYRVNGGEPDFGDKSVAEMTAMIEGGAK
jgi:predicted DsbA family dithiol-disulfide isomerase